MTPARYRIYLIVIGAFLSLGGLAGLVSALIGSGTGFDHARGVAGALVAIGLGVSIVVSGYSGQLPRWLAFLLGNPDDFE